MSRTTRKPAFAVEYSRKSWIKREIAYHARRPYTDTGGDNMELLTLLHKIFN